MFFQQVQRGPPARNRNPGESEVTVRYSSEPGVRQPGDRQLFVCPGKPGLKTKVFGIMAAQSARNLCEATSAFGIHLAETGALN
jgi:hypothetical protein